MHRTCRHVRNGYLKRRSVTSSWRRTWGLRCFVKTFKKRYEFNPFGHALALIWMPPASISDRLLMMRIEVYSLDRRFAWFWAVSCNLENLWKRRLEIVKAWFFDNHAMAAIWASMLCHGLQACRPSLRISSRSLPGFINWTLTPFSWFAILASPQPCLNPWVSLIGEDINIKNSARLGRPIHPGVMRYIAKNMAL